MIASGWGALNLSIDAPTRAPFLVSVRDESGRVVVRRRWRDAHHALPLPAGRLRLVVEDERAPHDVRRHGAYAADVEIVAGATTDHVAAMAPGATLHTRLLRDGAPVRFARVRATGPDGLRHDVRADHRGHVLVTGLRAGSWTLEATDARRQHATEPATVELAAGERRDLIGTLDQDCARLVVHLTSWAGRSVLAHSVTVVHQASGQRVTAPVRDGVADVAGLLPGRHTVEVPASLGHLAVRVPVGRLDAGSLSATDLPLPVGALLTGRVRHEAGELAAVVTLVAPDGTELERTRTDADGRYVLGTGLATAAGLTVVATTGPETLHVTRAATAEINVATGVRHDLGELLLPSSGRAAVWTPSTAVVGAMRLPSMRL